jgi:hypothetical protein
MFRQNLWTFLIFAAGSFMLTLLLVATPRLDATSPAPLGAAKPDAPKLTASGVELMMQYEGKTAMAERILVQPGKLQPLHLLARNTTDRSVEVSATITISVSEPASPLARTLPMPKQVWTHDQTIALGPGESRIITLKPDYTLVANSQITVVLGCGDERITPIHLAVPFELKELASAENK